MSLLLLIIKIIVGSIFAIICYGIGRRLIDAIGLEKRFTAKHWEYSISQFGELIVVVLLVMVVILAVSLVDYLEQLLN